jgi:NAD(P)H-dependent flavin oxidoreductase YrpB (nitropropane dioxygenase family)
MRALRTRLCDLLDVEFPIVQTGMGWVAGPRLAAATSNAGGLGILASATMNLEELRAAIAEMKSRTTKPFGVNLRTDSPDVTDRVELLIAEQVKVASFAMAPRADLVQRLRAGGLVVIPSIGAKRHAEKVVEMGVDAVLVQGGEGGGHTGSVPTTLLLPQVVDAVNVPVIAAGGFFDGRGLVAALAYGAEGIAMGTRFLLTKESTVPDAVKEYYLARTVNETLVTDKVDGFPHRVLRTEFVNELVDAGRVRTLLRALRNAWAYKRYAGAKWSDMLREGLAMRKAFDLSYAQMLMAANTPMLLRAAMVEGKLDFGVMASGQVVGVIDDLPTVSEVIERIVKEAEMTLSRLREPGPAPPV